MPLIERPFPALIVSVQESGIMPDASAPAEVKREDDLAGSSGHRVLIFAQLKSYLDIVESDVLAPAGISYLRLDGRYTPDELSFQSASANLQDPARLQEHLTHYSNNSALYIVNCIVGCFDSMHWCVQLLSDISTLMAIFFYPGHSHAAALHGIKQKRPNFLVPMSILRSLTVS